MWGFPGAARNALAQSHTALCRVDVLHAGLPVFALVPTEGSVEAQVGTSVMRSLGCTLADPTGELSGGDVEDLLSPYDCELAVYRGIRTAEADYYAPLGIFRPTQRHAGDDGAVRVTAQDRAIVYQGNMSGGLSISGNTSVESAIAKLLLTRNRGLRFRAWQTGYTCGPLIYGPEVDVWAEAQKLARSVGGWLYHDRVGELVFAPLLPTSTLAVARYGQGDGLLLSLTRQEDADTIHNVVVMRSTRVGNAGGVIQATVEDDDPASPTYANGRYGRRVLVITNDTISTLAQAQQAALSELTRELGRTETATASIVPDPTLDPLDMVTLHRPRVGLVERTLLINSMSVPLTAEGAMSLNFRKYILTRDGQTLDTDLIEM